MARLIAKKWTLPYTATVDRIDGNEATMTVHIRRWHPRLWWWLAKEAYRQTIGGE